MYYTKEEILEALKQKRITIKAANKLLSQLSYCCAVKNNIMETIDESNRSSK
jgi:hypothetical protein